MTHDTSAVVEAVPAERRSLFGTTEVGSGSWNDVPGRKGLNPLNRPLGEAIASVNEMAMRRQVEEKNHEVDDWLGHSSFALEDNVGRHDTSHSRDEMSPVVTDDWGPRTPPTSDIFVGVDDREPSLGDETENKPLPGQTYFIEDGPELSTVDLSLMRETAPWQDAPALFKIENVGEAKLLSQPETSHAAIARFESMCDDNNSVVSRAATWGTRRRTVPELDDIEGITSGLFLKKLSLGSRTQSKPSAFDGVRSLLKRSPPYAFLKRARTKEPEDGLVGMWKTLGGPPVPSLSTVPKPAVTEPDNEDDGESDLGDGDSGSLEPEIATSDFFKGCIPDFDRFRQHARKLNPMLSHTNAYLLDNVAHHQTARFDSLVSARTKHVSDVETQNCPSRFCCIALGGGPRLLHAKGDPTTTINVKDSDEEADPVPGTFRVAEENFSKGIPMPPTEGLPAQLECQTCYKVKTIWRPSDWTRHIIEDLQPYVCTYDGCLRRFKRKVDWARHENEVHRHHGWWACDEKDCRHKSYRRDDFLQHLVREHNLTAPKANTGGPTKRAGSTDPITWQKVEKCHHQSRSKPHDEPCRFCGKAFTTWKKLTDHLAKHMEEIALPLLSLVAREDLTPDNFVSPVDSPPPAPSRHGDSILASRAFFEHFTPVSPTINEKTPDRYAQMASQKDYMPDLSCDSGISMDPNGKGPSDECPGQSSSEEEPTDAETPGQLSAESHYSKSQREVENLDHRPARQVGIARIRVELLSVSRPGDGYDSEASEPLSADEGEGPVDDDGQRGEEESGNNPGSSGSSPGNPSSNTVQGPSGGSGSSGNGQQDSGSNERGSGGRGGGRKRRRQNSPDAAMKKTIQRFACPYQVYEPFQGCLGRGPRNPKGGCDGIYRLRQHLSRRHMLSSRCPTCWRSFDTKTKQDEHIKIAKCQERPRPVGELFMDTDHESEVEKPCGSMSEEDTWWKLFRLLIPGMETRDFCWLNTHYYPYYIAYDVSMTIPTLNFINTSFSQPQPETSTGDVSTTNGVESSQSLITDLTTPLLQPERPFMLSQTLSVPFYESAPRLQPPDLLATTSFIHPQATWTYPSTEPLNSSSDSQSNSNCFSTPMSSASAGPTQQGSLPFTQPSSITTSSDQTQLRRTNERLKARNQRAETEISELRSAIAGLREANRASRADLGRVDGILEELMDSQNVPAEMHESLNRLWNLLETASERLRKGS